jgi:hypothetical protein
MTTERPPDPPPARDASARIRPYVDGGLESVTTPADSTLPGLRPFVLTGGRVHGLDPDVGLETQVTARPPHRGMSGEAQPSLAPEQKAIIALCQHPVSVAEISAHLHLQLGVTRVLVGDLRASGHLDVHRLDRTPAHDPETILRVIRGLRTIT